MHAATLVFPHQLFENHPALDRDRSVILVEDSLFFGDPRYPLRFHKHKLILHCATMEHYAALLRSRGYSVEILRYRPQATFADLAAAKVGVETAPAAGAVPMPAGTREIHLCHVSDDVLHRRILKMAQRNGITLRWYESPGFLSPSDWLREQLVQEESPGEGTATGEALRPPRMHHFYIAQRRRMGILLTRKSGGAIAPAGGRWSFDTENRRPWPARTPVPPEPAVSRSTADAALLAAARKRVDREFPDNPGSSHTFWYPLTHQAARDWLLSFLRDRFPLFGPYEDAIAREGTVLYHSVLTPMLNTGLLTPAEVLAALDREFPLLGDIPDGRLGSFTVSGPVASPDVTTLLPGLEGFIRQVIGWREYIHGVYRYYGVRQRTANFWNQRQPMPEAFYTATTGIAPVDTVIRRVLDRSYCHHIERLMVLGNVMLLCEIDPEAVYRWFMELFIDAYDWVMVPNVYGMSQFADGGLLATKPYISGANYIRKMGDYPRGAWEDTWTALFWRFLHRHRSFFAEQPRMGMLVRQLDRDGDRTEAHLRGAEKFLRHLRHQRR